jgi:hypothetical protein
MLQRSTDSAITIRAAALTDSHSCGPVRTTKMVARRQNHTALQRKSAVYKIFDLLKT